MRNGHTNWCLVMVPGMDCDYAILTAYNSSDDECLDDVYGQVPLQMGCFLLTYSNIPLSVEMYWYV